MRKDEFTKCFEASKAGGYPTPEEWDLFEGCALRDFKPVNCTTAAVGRLIRYQCYYLNGGIDAEALNEIASIARRKFTLVD